MRLVIVSDTHDNYDYDVPDGDALLHCGDFTRDSGRQEFRRFDEWLGSLMHRYRIVIAGNHETSSQEASPYADLLLRNARYLEDSGIRIDGVKFYGSPWQKWFYDFAFNLPKNDDEAARKIWAKIPDDTDVLLTHGPPLGILDAIPLQDGTQEHTGERNLLARVQQVKPALHAFGHIHVARGIVRKGETLFVNAAMADGNYKIVARPIVVDLERRDGKLIATHIQVGQG